MAKLRTITPKEAANHIEDITNLFRQLAKEDVNSNSVFSADKEGIMRVFEVTRECTKPNILVRLTLIDSMYSTQMNRRYYALDELAEALLTISKGNKNRLRKLFVELAKSPESTIREFDYQDTNLFSENYGIGKDGSDKGVAISLISKYAYFETGFQFPIYDSIACEMFPFVWHFCDFRKPQPKLQVKYEKGGINGADTMVTYVKAINTLIKNFNIDKEPKCYDILDRFLWFVGKIIRGNLSLVLTREEYQETMRIYPPKEIKTTTTKGKEKISIQYFDIAGVNIDNLKYLDNNYTMREFFRIAKYYSTLK